MQEHKITVESISAETEAQNALSAQMERNKTRWRVAITLFAGLGFAAMASIPLIRISQVEKDRRRAIAAGQKLKTSDALVGDPAIMTKSTESYMLEKLRLIDEEAVSVVEKVLPGNSKPELHTVFFLDSDVLDPDSAEIDDETLNDFAGSRNLQIFQIPGEKVTDKGLEQLTYNPNIRHLSITKAGNITNNGLKHISQFKELNLLQLLDSKIDNQGLEHIVGMGIHILDLSGSNIDDRGMAILRKMPSLTNLGIQNTRVSAAGIREFAGTCVVIDAKRTPFACEEFSEMNEWEYTSMTADELLDRAEENK